MNIECTAWDLIGKYSELVDNTHKIFLPNGRVAYTHAAYVRTEQTVRLARLDDTPGWPRQINRYVHRDQKVVLVPDQP